MPMNDGFRIESAVYARLDSSSRLPSLVHPLITKYCAAPRSSMSFCSANVLLCFDILIMSIDSRRSAQLRVPNSARAEYMPRYQFVSNVTGRTTGSVRRFIESNN